MGTRDPGSFQHYLVLQQLELKFSPPAEVGNVSVTFRIFNKDEDIDSSTSVEGGTTFLGGKDLDKLVWGGEDIRLKMDGEKQQQLLCIFETVEPPAPLGRAVVFLDINGCSRSASAQFVEQGETATAVAEAICILRYRSEEQYSGALLANDYIKIRATHQDDLNGLDWDRVAWAAKLALVAYLGYKGDDKGLKDYSNGTFKDIDFSAGSVGDEALEFNNDGAYPWKSTGIKGGLVQTLDVAFDFNLLKMVGGGGNASGAQAFIAMSKTTGSVVIGVRGTDTSGAEDVFADADIRCVQWLPDQNCPASRKAEHETGSFTVTSGVLEQLNDIADIIFLVLDYLVNEKIATSVTVVGHSLGNIELC